jgi:AcrR family transcriptional regulator
MQTRQTTRLARHPPSNDDKEAEIFAAAVRIFRQKGYHAASMQDLADAVGLQKASLYYYFSSKEDLLLTVYERLTGAFTRQLAQVVDAPLDPAEKLRLAVETHIVALGEQLDLFTVYLNEQKFLNGRPRARIRAEIEKHAELLESILREGIDAHEFRECNVTITARAIIGMCNWIYQWYSPEGKLTPREIAVIFSDMVIDGVRMPPPRLPNRGRRREKSN